MVTITRFSLEGCDGRCDLGAHCTLSGLCIFHIIRGLSSTSIICIMILIPKVASYILEMVSKSLELLPDYK